MKSFYNAICQEDSPKGNIIQCRLNIHGEPLINVICLIEGDLNNAIPRLFKGDKISAIYENGVYSCTTEFIERADICAEVEIIESRFEILDL